MSYQMQRVFCATPGDLESERHIFYAVVGEVNETVGTPRGALLVPISVEARMVNKAAFQPAVDENVRACRFYVQVLADTWGPPKRNFRREWDLARECCAGVAVFFKRLPPEAAVEPDVAALKTELATDGAVRIFEYSGADDFKDQLRPLLSGWLG